MKHNTLACKDSYGLYQYVIDNPLIYSDPYGEGIIGRRPLNIPGLKKQYPEKHNYNGTHNYDHLHIFFDDGGNIGFTGKGFLGSKGSFFEEKKNKDGKYEGYDFDDYAPNVSNDCILRQAVDNVKKYNWRFKFYDIMINNCQDFVAAVVREYNRLLIEWDCTGKCGLRTKEECECNNKK